ncbi:hypothetical protein [Flavobacterium sp. NKUCC04_CG]|uniref:hypothetical protein n=1 Tax=Flavobacterium sp. NKUCC04_CG TaxID=2842121 RepID=UPI001C5AA578|nr:hypothetical protein [Flavobacterium sp. NKUCC04_CG]MBW3520434.1 hypothetical protein [Flavobacterium sp. NKUCC04_CG]
MILDFHKWMQTPELTKLTTRQKNDKLIQLIDINKFISGYHSEEIEMVDCLSSSVNIINIKENLSGLVFYELDSFFNESFHKNLARELLLKTKLERKLNELWLIFVKDDYRNTTVSIEPKQLSAFTNLFEQIFLFDFHKSSIQKII